MLADDLRDLDPFETEWVRLDAARVKAFADVTEDWQFIHLDEEKAALTEFGGTVAHGFLTLSMLSMMSYQVIDRIDGVTASINYGFDRIRFVSPVRVGRNVRGRFAVASVDEGAGWIGVHWDVQIDVEGEERPAIVANWITRLYP